MEFAVAIVFLCHIKDEITHSSYHQKYSYSPKTYTDTRILERIDRHADDDECDTTDDHFGQWCYMIKRHRIVYEV